MDVRGSFRDYPQKIPYLAIRDRTLVILARLVITATPHSFRS